jgi:cell division protein FtsB
MQKILLICLLLLLVVFNHQLHNGRGGRGDDLKIQTEINEQTKTNHQLADRNQMMVIKIEGLKGSSDALEARARHELNLVKPGEVLVTLPIINQNEKK